jgi:hypothetical protein
MIFFWVSFIRLVSDDLDSFFRANYLKVICNPIAVINIP